MPDVLWDSTTPARQSAVTDNLDGPLVFLDDVTAVNAPEVRGPSANAQRPSAAVVVKAARPESRRSHRDSLRQAAVAAMRWQFQGKPQSDHDIWDFVFTRDDGTSFWLHPNWSIHNCA